MQHLSHRQTYTPYLHSKPMWVMSGPIHHLKPKIQTQKSIKTRKFTLFCDCGGNPQHLVIPSLLTTVKTTFGRTRFLIHTDTRWHTLNNDSRLLSDAAEDCEILPGLPTQTHNVSHSFLIFHVKPILQTKTGELLIAQIGLDMFY